MFSPSSVSTHHTDHNTFVTAPNDNTCCIQQRSASGSSGCSRSPPGETQTPSSRARRQQQAGLNYTDNGDASPSIASTSDAPSAADSRFDSLHELLERAGYKETRVVTPDRHSLADMFAKKLVTPPRKQRMVDDFSDSPSLAADELRRAVQKSAAGRLTPRAATSKSLPSRNYKLATKDSPAASIRCTRPIFELVLQHLVLWSGHHPQ